MNRRLLWQTLLRRLGRHRSRTLFMGLGIAVGVAATVVLATVALGFAAQLRAFVDRAYPADGIVVFAGSGPMGSRGGAANLRLADLETIASQLSIADWDPVVSAGPREVQRAGVPLRVPLLGVSERAARIRRRAAVEGEFFSAADVRSAARVALIGSTTARTLFANGSAVGQELVVDTLRFEVRGVLETVGADPHGGDQDNVLWIPYTTLMDRMSRSPMVSAATFRVADTQRLDAISRDMTRILRQEHSIAEGQRDDFTVITPRIMSAMVNRSLRTFAIFLPLILGTVFLISALVIWALQQASVRARTAEIGLRKAVGARRRDVRFEVLLEVLLLAAVAAVAGAVAALIVLRVLEPGVAVKFGIQELRPPPGAWLAGLAGALGAALLGAILPARRAARLQPVDALRERR